MYDHFMSFIDDENDIDEHFGNLVKIINQTKCQETPEEFKSLLYLISEIGANHHRSSSQISKIERILSQYEKYIKQSFSNDELVNIFKKNPQILHFLIKKDIITVDDSMIKLIHKKRQPLFLMRQYPGEKPLNYETEKIKYYTKKLIYYNYKYYFFLDVKSKLSEAEQSEIENALLDIDKNIFENFDKKCQIGENDSYICELIREDLIDEFVAYISQSNLPITSEIKPSIFETNTLLISRPATLIEYAAFFGSIQIFNYLRMNEAEMTPSLWIYAIHGNNANIIHILEDCGIEPEDKTYLECMKESIKCHHNSIAEYIQNFLMKEDHEVNENDFKNNLLSYGYHYYNYKFIHISENLQYPLFYACLYDHFPIVKLLINDEKIDSSSKIIYNTQYL